MRVTIERVVGWVVVGVAAYGCSSGDTDGAPKRADDEGARTGDFVALPAGCDGMNAARCAARIAKRGPNSQVAVEVDRLRQRFHLADGSRGSFAAIGSGKIQRLDASAERPGALHAVVPIPELKRGPWESTAKPVRVDLPLSARGVAHVGDGSGVAVGFRLVGADNVEPEFGDGIVMYPGAYRGGHVVHRATFTGVEDYVVLGERPPVEELHYEIDVRQVAGLRLIDDRVLELLDAGGAPRLRMNAPYLVTEAGERVEARIALGGCEYDASAAPPWDRPVTSPGSATCDVVVSWSDATYPALFDPLWQSTGLTLEARGDGVAAFVLPGTNGNVMIAGGGRMSSEIFNPASGTFSTLRAYVDSLRVTRAAPAGPSGWAVGFGGFNYTNVEQQTQAYDPYAHAWQSSYDLLVPIDAYATGVALAGTTYNLLIVGGASNIAQTLTSTGFWGPVVVGGVSWPHRLSASVALGSGALVAGGAPSSPLAPTGAAISWGASNLVAYPTGSMTTARANHTGTRLTDGTVLMVGGLTGATASTATATAERYLPALGGVFQLTGGALNLARYAHVAAPIPGGRVLVAGGGGPAPGVGQSAEIYVEATQQFVRITDPPVAWGHSSLYPGLPPDMAAAPIGDGSVLIVGHDFPAFRQAAVRFTLRPLGEACDRLLAVECAFGYCVDGVCCDSACDGTCEACSNAAKGQGNDGVCGPVKAGTADSACAPNPPCGLTGKCDGSGSGASHCAYASDTTTCNGGPACTNETTAVNPRCDGSGGCAPHTALCREYKCSGTACLTSCTQDSHCAAGYYCNPLNSKCENIAGAGDPCTTQSQCPSNTTCIDGVCCNAPCSGRCMACTEAKTGLTDGECGAITTGTDPDAECAAQVQDTCGTTGFCEAGACQLWNSSTVCNPGSVCVGSQLTQYRCSGSGSCLGGSPQDCPNGFACSGSACRTTCAGNGDCAGAYYCDAPTCKPKKGQAQDCADDAECQTGYCVDGKCCNDACEGTCEACSNAAKGQGSDGICGLVVGGLDPHGSCTPGNPSSCGFDGSCNGLGACSFYQGNSCLGGATCDGNSAVGQFCNGQGTCITDNTGVPCEPFKCIINQGCATSCASDGDCSSTSYYCEQSSCQPKKAAGATCQTANQCASGYCVDGVCCENACTSKCQACSNVKKGAGEDGKCEPILADRDPDEECDADPASSCQYRGTCDGTGGCALHRKGTACGATQCNGNSVVGQVCDGAGSCVFDPAGAACAPFACNALFGTCNSSCTTSSDCATGDYFCEAGVCAQKQINGQPCSEDAACVSGQCTDGLCCDSECTGQCEACDVTGFEGTCSAIGADEAPHPDRQACAATDAECAGRCDGTQRACVYPGQQILCSTSACDGNVLKAVRCNSQGACVADQARDCGAYACDAETANCKSSCETNADCATGSRCNPGTSQCAPSDATCSDAYTLQEVDGTSTSCAPYECSAGVCRDDCGDDGDCAEGYSCLGSKCVAVGDAGSAGAGAGGGSVESNSGCGCRTVGGSQRAPTGWLALGLLGVTLARRRRRRAQEVA